jgi:hypothetical protein
VVAPVTAVPIPRPLEQIHLDLAEKGSLQFLGSHHLLHITRVGVEHEDQSFVVEVGHLALQWGDILDLIALRDLMLRDRRSGRLIIEQGVDLG